MRLALPSDPPLRISLMYALIASAWILISDTLLQLIAIATQTSAMLQTIKGWLFVVVTALLLYLVLRREYDARLAADAERAASEAGFQAMFAYNPLAMWIYDLETLRFLAVNDAAITRYGYSREEFLRMRITDIHLPEEPPGLLAMLRQRQGDFQMSGEWRHRTRGGALLDIQTSSHTLRFAGRATALVIAEDITARKQAEREREELLARAEAARAEAEQAQQRAAFLARATGELASSLDYATTLESVARLALGQLADWCVIELFNADQTLQRIAVVTADPGKQAVAQALHAYPSDLDAPEGAGRAARTGQSAVYTNLSNADLAFVAHDERHLELLRSMDLTSAMIVPLLARGRILGVLMFSRAHPGRPYDDDELALAEELARRAALAIDHARLYREVQAVVRSKEEALAVLNMLLAAAPIGLAFVDPELRYVHANRLLSELHQLPPQGHVGRRLRDVIPSLALRLEPLYHAVLETGEPIINQEISAELPATPGQLRHWLASYYPVQLPDGPILGVGAIVVEMTAHKQTEDMLRQSSERLQALSRRLVEVQEAERRHLARELHDEIGQALTGLNLLLEISHHAPPEGLAARLSAAQSLVNDLTSRVRQLSLDLRPAMLDDMGLLPTLQWYIERYTALTQVQVNFKCHGLDSPIPADVAIAVYRVVQEALTNVARYAGVMEASVYVWADASLLSVQVEDQGRGFAVEAALAAHQSSGLAGMVERAMLLGGELTIDSQPGAGTCLTAAFPLDASARRSDAAFV